MSRSVLVTGASTGIGEATARFLRDKGWRVFAGVRTDADADKLSKFGVEPIVLDVTDADHIASAAKHISDATGGKLDGLVNNAGIAGGGPLEFLSLDSLREVLEVNVVGQVAMTQAFLPQIRAARGRIVFVGSIAGKLAAPFTSPYAASKHALEAITDSLRVELRPWKIEVSLIEPAAIATPIWQKGRESGEGAYTPEALELYAGVLDAMMRAVDDSEAHGLPPIEVAKVIHHALAAPKPKTRYLLGPNSRLSAALARFAPDRMRDSAIVKKLGLPEEQRPQ